MRRTYAVSLRCNPTWIGAALLIAGMWVSATSAVAKTCHVSPGGESIAPYTNWNTAARSVQAALAVASSGDTVLVTNGTYDLPATLSIVSGVRLASVNGSTWTELRGNNSKRCLYVEHPDAVVDGFRITRGRTAEDGGGVYLAGGAQLIHCFVSNCTARSGGGVYVVSGGRVSDCTIQNNTAQDRGGGVNCLDGGSVLNSRLLNNSAVYGGGAHCDTNAWIGDCVVQGNSAYYGGGIRLRRSGRAERCTVQNNAAARRDSGQYGAEGGGVQIVQDGSMVNCLVSGNTSQDFGGGVLCRERGLILNCTISGNQGGVSGGGFYGFQSATVRNTILFFNLAPDGANHSGSGSNIYYSAVCAFPAPAGTNNISLDPMFRNIAAGDYRLRGDSSCIDRGMAEGAPVLDLQNLPRPLDGDGVGGRRIDLGAFEYASSTVDEDRDGLPDGWEVDFGLNPISKADALTDPDGDFLPNNMEFLVGTAPNDGDTDRDGMWDGWEWLYSTGNPAHKDPVSLDPRDGGAGNLAQAPTGDLDQDGVANLDEFRTWYAGYTNLMHEWYTNAYGAAGFDTWYSIYVQTLVGERRNLFRSLQPGAGNTTNRMGLVPTNPDTDSDGMTDGWELANRLRPENAADALEDPDHDRLANVQEFRLGTDPRNPDSDRDGNSDGWEARNCWPPDSAQNIPAAADSDRDGLADAQELTRFGTNPRNALDPLQVNGTAQYQGGADGSRDRPFRTIQEALDAAPAGSVIVVRNGQYSLAGNHSISTRGKALRLLAESSAVVIDTQAWGPAFVFNHGEKTNTVIQGFSIRTWADAGDFSGVICAAASPTIVDCLIRDCGAYGIQCATGAAPVVVQTRIFDCAGGILCEDSSPRIDRCQIATNQVAGLDGGGICLKGRSAPQILNSLIAKNRAGRDGGGLYVDVDAAPLVLNCTIADNHSVRNGGGIASRGTFEIRNSILWGNTKGGQGDGIYRYTGTGAVRAWNSDVQGNWPGVGMLNTNPLFAAVGDYRLRSGSPCIDKGIVENGDGSALALSDWQVAVPRVLHGDGNTNTAAACDMGAYEFVDAAVDTDADGMPDQWEIDHGLNAARADAEWDEDADGLSNLQEYQRGAADPFNPDTDRDGARDYAEWIAGTDPRSAADALAVELVAAVSNQWKMTWNSVSGRLYSVQVAPDPQAGWRGVASLTNLAGTNGMAAVTTTNLLPRGFYRLSVRLSP